jgi:N-acetylglucosaminyl-diphospho-decaprenol L-rhamnosyltransferase
MLELRVTAVLVTYNSGHCVAGALGSLPPGVVTIVVDNGSADDTVQIARQKATHVVEMGRNFGFAKACNTGAAIAKTEFLLMMNPDSLASPDAIATLVAAAGRHPAATGFNPRLENGATNDGEVVTGDRPVPSLSGAALFVRKQLFDEVGRFDERFFLYFEDADLSARLATKGPLMEIPAAHFTHAIGQSSRLTLRDEFRKYRHYGRSRVYYNAKHNRHFNRSREALGQGLKAIHRLVIGRTRHAAQHLGRAVGYLNRSPVP